MSRFSWKCQHMSDMMQETIWNIFFFFFFFLGGGGTHNSFFYYLGPFLLEIPRNKSWMYNHDFLGYGHREQQATLFHTWIDCFTLLKLGAVAVCALGVFLVLFINQRKTNVSCLAEWAYVLHIVVCVHCDVIYSNGQTMTYFTKSDIMVWTAILRKFGNTHIPM